MQEKLDNFLELKKKSERLVQEREKLFAKKKQKKDVPLMGLLYGVSTPSEDSKRSGSAM